MNQSPPKRPRQIPSRWRRWRRPVTLILLAGVTFAGGMAGIVWWQERPLRQAAALLDKGDPKNALDVIDGFLRDQPTNIEAISLRARALVAAGRPAEAIDVFDRFGGTSLEDMHAWAQALLQLNRWRAALPPLEYLSTTDLDRADVLYELARCRDELGDLKGAIAAASEFASQPGCAARGNLLLGRLYHKQGKNREVAAAFADVLKHAPDAEGLQIPAAEFLLDYGRILQPFGNSRLAVEMVERSLKLNRGAAGLALLGDARSSLGENEAAETAYKESLEIESNLPAARIGLARLALVNRDAAGAKEWLSKLQSPELLTREVAVLLQQATAQLGDREASIQWREKADALGLKEQAREAAIQVLREQPDSRLAQIVHAYLLAETGNWEQAGFVLQPIVALAENHPFLRRLLQAVQRRSELPPLEELPLKPL